MSDENEAEIMEEMHSEMNSARIAQSLPDEYLKSILKRCKSDTPRTDAACGFHDMDTAVDAGFARQLERELNAANSKLNRKCQCQAFKDAQESGTDNESYGALVCGKQIGCGLPDAEFCPWCGGAV